LHFCAFVGPRSRPAQPADARRDGIRVTIRFGVRRRGQLCVSV